MTLACPIPGAESKCERKLDKYRVLRVIGDRIDELAVFDNEADAVDLADRAKYMRPFVYKDDGSRVFTTRSREEILEHALRVAGRPV